MSKKIICWDVETTPGIFATWSLTPEYIPHEGILKDWSLICVSWKILGEKEVQTATITKPDDDLLVVKKVYEAFKDADLLVAHNGDKFDVKKLNTRIIYHGLDPLPPIQTLDTMKELKKVAAFTSNSLDYECKFLGLGEKKKTRFNMWLKIREGDKVALKEMVDYNRHDVLLLEKLYLRTRKYFPNPPSMASTEGISCVTCGSKDITSQGTRTTKAGMVYPRFKCNACRSWFQGKNR